MKWITTIMNFLQNIFRIIFYAKYFRGYFTLKWGLNECGLTSQQILREDVTPNCYYVNMNQDVSIYVV